MAVTPVNASKRTRSTPPPALLSYAAPQPQRRATSGRELFRLVVGGMLLYAANGMVMLLAMRAMGLRDERIEWAGAATTSCLMIFGWLGRLIQVILFGLDDS